MEISFKELGILSKEVGLELVGSMAVAEANQVLKEHSEHLRFWQESGKAGEMNFMLRSPQLFSDLKNFLPTCRSVVCFVISYNHGVGQIKSTPEGCGRVARYAWGKDYHLVLKDRLKALVEKIQNKYGNKINSRVFSDAVPILERALVESVQLGFVGKNTMLIRPGLGSFTFLAEIIWDVKVVGDEKFVTLPSRRKEPAEKSFGSCGQCQSCLDNCPTGAIIKPGEVDARKCISYLTIEKKTEFDDWEQSAINDWIFGCDVCQDVCPFNHEGTENSVIPEFRAEEGVGEFLKLSDIFSISSNKQYAKKFQGTALLRAGRKSLIRNACCVAANTKYFPAIPDLIRLSKDDSSELVRNQAQKSLEALKTT